jgi:hypothetical protein
VRTRSAILSVAAVLCAVAAGPAAAQYYGGVVPPSEIAAIVREEGFDPISRPVLQGRYYVLRALDRAGIELRIVVEARIADIVSVRPVGRAMGGYAPGPRLSPPRSVPPRVVTVPPDLDGPGMIDGRRGRFEDEPMVPPRAVPGGPGPKSAARPPGPTPLPRTRPGQDSQAATTPAAAAPAPAATPQATKPAAAAQAPSAPAAEPAPARTPDTPPINPLE